MQTNNIKIIKSKDLKSQIETKTHKVIVKAYVDNYVSIVLRALEMNGDKHPSQRVKLGMRSPVESYLPILMAFKYNSLKFNGLETGLLFNKTARQLGFVGPITSPIDMIARLANGTYMGFEWDGAIHLAKLLKKRLGNDALVSEILERATKKLVSFKNTRSSKLYVMLQDSPALYGGVENLNRIIKEVNKNDLGIVAINMTQYQDRIFTGPTATAQDTYAAIERLRSFAQYSLNLTCKGNYYKVTLADMAGTIIAYHLYSHPYKDGMAKALKNIPLNFTKECELTQYFRDNEIPYGIGYAAVSPYYVEKLQQNPVTACPKRTPKVIKLEGVGYKMLVAAKRSKGK